MLIPLVTHRRNITAVEGNIKPPPSAPIDIMHAHEIRASLSFAMAFTN